MVDQVMSLGLHVVVDLYDCMHQGGEQWLQWNALPLTEGGQLVIMR